MNQNVFLNLAERLKTQETVHSYIVNVFKNGSVYLFYAAVYNLIFVVDKDALFHYDAMLLNISSGIF
jgi:hypothetical protein